MRAAAGHLRCMGHEFLLAKSAGNIAVFAGAAVVLALSL